MKPKIIKIIILFFVILLLLITFKTINKQNNILKASLLKKHETIKIENKRIVKNEIKQNIKTPQDTTIVFYFKDLSNIYNYEIIDKFYNTNNGNYYDSILRIVKIFDKKDSLIQKIYPNIKMSPWYFILDDYDLRLSRSYITGKNANYDDMDNYCGEIVVADLNFDGLDDFATPVSSGVDNGPHYEFYIQNNNHKFEFNYYLTKKVVWFPEIINDSLMSFTCSVPCGVYAMFYHTFEYDTISMKWEKTEDYTIEY